MKEAQTIRRFLEWEKFPQPITVVTFAKMIGRSKRTVDYILSGANVTHENRVRINKVFKKYNYAEQL